MSAWSSRPRVTPFAGHRKPTSRWCVVCEALHRTHRAVEGEEPCPQAKSGERGAAPLLPHVRRAPRGVDTARVTR